MNQFKEQTDKAVEILNNARTQLTAVLTSEDLGPLKNKLVLNLEQQINAIAVMNGGQTVSAQTTTEKGPLKKMFGKVLTPPPTDQNSPQTAPTSEETKAETKDLITKTPQQVAADELRERRDVLHANILTMENDVILDSYNELEIRAVGKLAGLPVTEQSPKKVDGKFIDQIKDAIKQKQDLENKGKTDSGTSGQGTTGTTTSTNNTAGSGAANKTTNTDSGNK